MIQPELLGLIGSIVASAVIVIVAVINRGEKRSEARHLEQRKRDVEKEEREALIEKLNYAKGGIRERWEHVREKFLDALTESYIKGNNKETVKEAHKVREEMRVKTERDLTRIRKAVVRVHEGKMTRAEVDALVESIET